MSASVAILVLAALGAASSGAKAQSGSVQSGVPRVWSLTGGEVCRRPVPPVLPAPGSGSLATAGGSLWATARLPGHGTVVANLGQVRPLPSRSRHMPAVFTAGRVGAVLADGSRLTTLPGVQPQFKAGHNDDHPAPSALGDGGPIAGARFRDIRVVAADQDGNLLVADRAGPGSSTLVRVLNLGAQPAVFYGGTARQVTIAPGSIDTVAMFGGGRAVSPPGRDLPVIAGEPAAMAGVEGRLYLASQGPGSDGTATAVHMINLGDRPITAHGSTVAPGREATVAGGHAPGYSGDGGPATKARFGELSAISADARGNLYVADVDNHRIRRIDNAGAVSTFVGTGRAGPGLTPGASGPARETALGRPVDVDVDQSGRVLVFDESDGVIQWFGPDGMAHAGCETPFAGPPGPDGQPSLLAPSGGALYTAGPELDGVQRVAPDGQLTLAAELTSLRTCRADDCQRGQPGSFPPVPGPVSIAGSPTGALYMLDGRTGIVRAANLGLSPLTLNGVSIPPRGIRKVAGNGAGARSGAGGHTGDGGPAQSAELTPLGQRWSGQALASDSEGGLFVIDGDRVRRVDRRGITSTVVAPAAEGIGTPRLLATDPMGNLLVADESRLWLFNRGAETLHRYGVDVPAGTLAPVPHTDVGPAGLTVSSSGDVYLASSIQHGVRRLSPDGAAGWIAGTGVAGFNGDGRPGSVTMLSSPSALAIDANGDLLIVEGGGRIRRLALSEAVTESRSPRGDTISPGFLWPAGGLFVVGMAGLLALLAGWPPSGSARRFAAIGVGVVMIGSGVAAGHEAAPAVKPWARAPAADQPQLAPPMAAERSLHTATLLDPPSCRRTSPPSDYPCGEVLVVGGTVGMDEAESSPVELFDPSTGQWKYMTPMPVERLAHTATLLSDGRVLVAGGESLRGSSRERGTFGTNRSELYDPRADSWTPTAGPMVQGRFFQTATALDAPACHGAPAGRPAWCGKVLVAGGSDRQKYRPSLASAELFDPATGMWTAVAPMATARQNQIASLLPDGSVLVAGGLGPPDGIPPGTLNPGSEVLSSAEVFDPDTGQWSAAAPMATPRAYAAATALDSADCLGRRPPEWCGRVMVTGGYLSGVTEEQVQYGEATVTAEIFDPAETSETGVAGVWRPARSMGTARQGHTSTLLLEGRVFIAGGEIGKTVGPDKGSTEVYDIATDKWSPAGPMATEKLNLTATRLDGPLCRSGEGPPWCGGVLVAGGSYDPRQAASIEVKTLDTVEFHRPPPPPRRARPEVAPTTTAHVNGSP